MDKAIPILSAIAVSAFSAFAGPVEQYGRLYADGSKIVGERSGGSAVQLKGPSLQWSVAGWGSDKFFLTETVDAMAGGWMAQVIRAPLGIAYVNPTDPGDEVTDGYNVDSLGNWERVERVVDAAIERGVYAILDWHSHSAHNADEIALAADFFTRKVRGGKYGNDPAVIFEIYNEPTAAPTWAQVKASSEAVIKAIRDAGFNNLILVGSPHWDTETNLAAADPPADPAGNIAFTFHFYASAHRIASKPYFSPAGTTYRSVVQGALDAGYPVFVSEWGTNDATEDGAPNFAEADKWHAYLDSNKISSCAWGATASGYYGSNALDYWTRWGNPLHFGYADAPRWTDPFRMTPHGRYIYRWLTGGDTASAPASTWPQFAGLSSPIEFPPFNSGKWSTLTDNGDGGKSEADANITDDGALYIEYKLDKGAYRWEPYVGALLGAGELSRCEYGIGYAYKGSAHSLRVEQSNVTDWDYHINYKPTPRTSDWTEVRIPWGYFWQEEWDGVQTAPRNPSLVERLNWYIIGPSGRIDSLWVKDAQCLGDKDGDDYVSSIRQSRKAASQANASHYLKISNRTIRLRLPQPGKVEIFNLKGGKIKTVKLKQGGHVLKMNNLPKGMYMVRASSGEALGGSVKMFLK